MTTRKKLAVLAAALVCMALFAGCTGSGGSAADQSAPAVTSAVSAEPETESTAAEADASTADEAEASATADADSTETQDETPVSMGEMEVLEDDEDYETEEEAMEALDEQYSDFTDADISLPIIP